MSTEPSHNFLERALHRFAFATRRAQLGIADLEERMFGKELRATVTGAPVFVTSLPRAGTTMLLEVLAGCPEFATQTYRDMPFVLCPMLWRSMSRRSRRTNTPHERAHGDGIQISLDSPEAFEEVLWATFWQKHYGAHTITPWQTCQNPEFLEFFAAHRRKVVALRARQEPRARRYLSKNNQNIARLPALLDAVPDAIVLVPFRDPLQQAASLLQQHRRFTELHRESSFARRYMAGIGHFDFGANLRPIDFDGWFGTRRLEAALQLPFWLDYWLATYRYLLTHPQSPRLVFVDFAELAATRNVAPLAAGLGLEDATGLAQQAQRLRPLPPRKVEPAKVPTPTREAIQQVFAALQQRALR